MTKRKRCNNCVHRDCRNLECEHYSIYGLTEPYNGNFDDWRLCPCVKCNFDIDGSCKFYEPYEDDV